METLKEIQKGNIDINDIIKTSESAVRIIALVGIHFSIVKLHPDGAKVPLLNEFIKSKSIFTGNADYNLCF